MRTSDHRRQTIITPGQILENPVTGERFTFTDTAASHGGELLGFEFAPRVGGAVPIPHVHPIQTERFEVSGEVVLPVGDMPEPFVNAGDIADVAAAALTDDGHAGQLYELTEPRALPFAEATQEIAQAGGRKVSFVPVPIDAYATAAAEEGVPTDVLAQLRYLFTEVLDGHNVNLADGVQRGPGRPARDFAHFARQAAASGIWRAP
jgi:hypothetical protein